ncbi:hypothetical protein HAX54_021971 [Datura stramonium]|uniref:Uncharacterized protein n=1 Tax=Datura stramonium TaxID=4076 RepID=A0ABS8S3Z9_DATST|nr:hypothetical protein [Datura stramonium]
MEPQQSCWFRFTIAAYQPYFDVDTSDVLERIKDSLFPFKDPSRRRLPVTQICMARSGYAVPFGFAALPLLLCLYGYSLFVFIPALCLSLVPWEIVRWVGCCVAGFMSATFVV